MYFNGCRGEGGRGADEGYIFVQGGILGRGQQKSDICCRFTYRGNI